jgi:hypothetical protein
MRPLARYSAFVLTAVAALTLGCETQPASAPSSTILSDRADAPGFDQACSDRPGEHRARRPHGAVALLCAFALPSGSKPILNGTKSWVEGRRYYVTELANAAVYVFDVITHRAVGSVTGFVGSTGNAATSGPNSIAFSDDGHAWVSDGNSAVQVVDLRSMSIIATVSTVIPGCDNGTVHNCQRTNEITFDPEDRIIFVGNPSPLDTSKHGGASFPTIDTYATFISATAPYKVLGHISFANRTNTEAPLWDPALDRLLISVGGRLVGTTVYPQYVGVVNPKTMLLEQQYVLDCQVLTPGVPLNTFGINDPALGPDQHVVVPACGHAVVFNGRTGNVLAVFRQIGGGNETWYNRGDNRFYVTGIDSTATPPVNSLGVIDASSVTFLQGVPAVGATNPASSAENNETFAVVPANATAGTACTAFGLQGSGCILVFGHVPDDD